MCTGQPKPCSSFWSLDGVESFSQTRTSKTQVKWSIQPNPFPKQILQTNWLIIMCVIEIKQVYCCINRLFYRCNRLNCGRIWMGFEMCWDSFDDTNSHYNHQYVLFFIYCIVACNGSMQLKLLWGWLFYEMSGIVTYDVDETGWSRKHPLWNVCCSISFGDHSPSYAADSRYFIVKINVLGTINVLKVSVSSSSRGVGVGWKTTTLTVL